MSEYKVFSVDIVNRTILNLYQYQGPYEVTQLINSCLALIVYFKELNLHRLTGVPTEFRLRLMNVLTSNTKLNEDQNYSVKNILRHIRNSIAHGRIEQKTTGGLISGLILIDQGPNSNSPNFEFEISVNDLRCLVEILSAAVFGSTSNIAANHCLSPYINAQAAINLLRNNSFILSVKTNLEGHRRIPVKSQTDSIALIENLPNHPGLYLFWIKCPNDWEQFTRYWRDDDVKHSPSIIKSRIAFWRHEDKDEVPLYLGKAKKIGSRLREHVFHDSKKQTYSLKLFARRHFSDYRISVSYIEAPKMDDIDIMLGVLESKLIKDFFCPIVGKQ